jgi:enoyl-CoA hydratase/carnithine racemase
VTSTAKKVLLEKRDGVAWATLNDYEDARNALGNEVSRAMLEILEDVAKDDSIGVLCITRW